MDVLLLNIFTTMLLEKVTSHCEHILTSSRCAMLPFHNLEHTKDVVKNVKRIGEYEGFWKEEIETLEIAAWFHDTGHSECYSGHEDVSKRLAEEFLEKEGCSREIIAIVLACIEATKMPQSCSDHYAAALCDADILHIGTSDFFFKKLLLRREWDLMGVMKVSDNDWHILNRDFIHGHHFKTKYGKEVLEKGKLENERKVDYILSFCG